MTADDPMAVDETLNTSKRLSALSLFTSFSTLICCALPALLVALGAGAVLSTLVSHVPQLVWVSEHKQEAWPAPCYWSRVISSGAPVTPPAPQTRNWPRSADRPAGMPNGSTGFPLGSTQWAHGSLSWRRYCSSGNCFSGIRLNWKDGRAGQRTTLGYLLSHHR
jgi:hypothetical protein